MVRTSFVSLSLSFLTSCTFSFPLVWTIVGAVSPVFEVVVGLGDGLGSNKVGVRVDAVRTCLPFPWFSFLTSCSPFSLTVWTGVGATSPLKVVVGFGNVQVGLVDMAGSLDGTGVDQVLTRGGGGSLNVLTHLFVFGSPLAGWVRGLFALGSALAMGVCDLLVLGDKVCTSFV